MSNKTIPDELIGDLCLFGFFCFSRFAVVFACNSEADFICSALEADELFLHRVVFPAADTADIVFFGDCVITAASAFHVVTSLLAFPVFDARTWYKEGSYISVLGKHEKIVVFGIEIQIVVIVGVFMKN